MKNLVLLFLFVSTFVIRISAQEKVKFGDISPDLLKMTVYEKDTAASAVVLYERCDVYYDISSVTADFEVITDYTVRIKILTQDGVELANQSIPFYKGSTRILSEDIQGLTGFTYNLEGDKIVKEKLSKDYIFTEDITENRKRMKFAMPAVKEGSVFEYKYRKTSPYYSELEDYKFQRSIPVQYSYFLICVPEYFRFNRETKGYQPIKVNVKRVDQTMMFKTLTLRCSAEEISAEVRDLPALKDESFVWNYNDFSSGITFELKSVEIPGQFYKNYTQTWGDVVKQLNESSVFGKQLNNKNLFKDELPLALDSKTDDQDKIRAILDMVRGKVKWNEKATLGISNVKKALKEGVGTSGEINALLLCALTDAGFDAAPVVMSLRSRGRIPMTYPSIDNLNYFIVAVTSEDKRYFLDATLPYTDINVIPIDCMVDRALFVQSGKFDWIDLINIGRNISMINMVASFDEEGILSGNYSEIHGGEYAFLFRKSYDEAKNQDDYIEKEENNNGIRISDYNMEERREKSFSYIEKYNFRKNDIRLEGNEVLTINPLLFAAAKSNPLKQETRNLPVEFMYPYEKRINIALTIPEGYVLDEAPQPVKYTYENDEASFSYIIKQQENVIQTVCTFNLKTCVVPAVNYEYLRDFWSKYYAKCNEFLALKKVSN